MRKPVLWEAAPPRWNLSRRPPFIEAYPTFSVGEAHREAGRSRHHLLWRDQKAQIVGAALADWPSLETLHLRYRIEELAYLEADEGEITLPVTWKGSQDNNQRPFTRCPLCLRSAEILVFVGTWCCSSIHHGHRHRSACLREEVRWSEDLAEVEGRIAANEAVGTSGKKHLALVSRRDELLNKLRQRPVTADALKLAAVSREWIQPIALKLR